MDEMHEQLVAEIIYRVKQKCSVPVAHPRIYSVFVVTKRCHGIEPTTDLSHVTLTGPVDPFGFCNLWKKNKNFTVRKQKSR